MSINNREDLNKYSEIINKLIDNYIYDEGIRPSKLNNYLKRGSDKFKKFIIRNGLEGINKIEEILEYMIMDRVYMETDGILTLENFKIFESDHFKITSLMQCLYKGIGKSDINAEKFLADHFDSNLSQIDIVDSDKHMFKIDNWENDNILVIIYNKDEMDIIKNNIKEYLIEQLSKEEVDLIGLPIKIEDIVDKSKTENHIESKLDDKRMEEIIFHILLDMGISTKFEKVDDYYLWISDENL
jgi:hypothetical protein